MQPNNDAPVTRAELREFLKRAMESEETDMDARLRAADILARLEGYIGASAGKVDAAKAKSEVVIRQKTHGN